MILVGRLVRTSLTKDKRSTEGGIMLVCFQALFLNVLFVKHYFLEFAMKKSVLLCLIITVQIFALNLFLYDGH